MKDDFRNFNISSAFFRIASDLQGIYGVINFYLIFGNSFFHAFGIYAVLYFVNSLLVRPAMSLIAKIGTRNAMILSCGLFVLSFIPLYALPSKQLAVVGAWILLYAAAKALYYPSLEYYLSKLTEEKNRGSKLGGRNSVMILFSIITPFVGGYVSEFWGIQGLALVMSVFFILAIIPLLKIENYRFQIAGKVSKIMFSPDTLKIVKVTIVNELHTKETVWQVYVFILLGSSFAFFGNVATLVAIISIIVSILIGRILDHHSRKHVLQLDSLISSLFWFLRSMVSSISGIIFIDSMFKINNEVKNEAIDTIYYDLLAKKNQDQLFDEKIIAREIWVTFIIGLNMILSYILVNFFGFQTAFIFAGLSSLFFWLL